MESYSTSENKTNGLAKVICSKLVRDNTVSIIESKGGKCHSIVLQKNKCGISLKKKLLEESKEIVKTENRQDLLEELCDVFEVFRNLLKFYKMDLTRLLSEYYKKYKTSILDKNIFLTKVTIANDDTHYFNIFSQMGKKLIKESTDQNTTFLISKMVFDDFIEEGKYKYETLTLDHKSICYELKRLLVDISRWVLNNSDIIYSFGKIFIVFNKIINTFNIEFSTIVELADKKCEINGGFNKFVFLQSIDFTKDNEYFKVLSGKYQFIDIKE